ncbi:3-phosphoshikimate 1-carboxyvinyltransferase [Taibaiella soli]|uniref:3-phosphoshikimate 1-carboxyvinyltransferase n=1 Tax=Taibaiella soli TaxID=1649169 RepID=A0A2W2B832_9BACT|nr:3-phosphoshikimate 1-carboxyvinyltransferase [Taibaiella soli]PZF72439.1 3-phosphoshikimate 1-carboxyvinyltransferase [Taibaiella soli]
MQVSVSPGKIHGTVCAPGSKSMMQRVCAAALLHRGTTIIHNPGISNDDKAALEIIRQLGASIEARDGSLVIESNGINPISDVIDCGESGLSARLFTSIAALYDGRITITGHGSLLRRQMFELKNILLQSGKVLEDFNGFLPLTISAPFHAGDLNIDGTLSSQYLTGALFALSFSAEKEITITVSNPKSKPYIDLTLKVLADFGKEVTHDQYEVYHISPSVNEGSGIIVRAVETDWSSAAAWIVAGAIAGDIIIQHLDKDTTQADARLLDVLKDCGADFHWEGDSLHIRQTNALKSFSFDATECPDLFPVLSVLAGACEGRSEITGIHRLEHKESDRAYSTGALLRLLGLDYTAAKDTLFIEGKSSFNGGTISSYNDHRMVMAAAIAALRADSEIVIENAEAVAKSYPDFFKHLQSLQVRCTQTI